MATSEARDTAFNVFHDQTTVFTDAFYDPEPGDRYTVLTRHIVTLLTEGHSLPVDDPAHPIQRFGHPDRWESNFLRLHQQLVNDFQGSSIQGLLIAFFHSTGLYREELDDLLEQFDRYAHTCLDLPYDLPTSNDDEEGA